MVTDLVSYHKRVRFVLLVVLALNWLVAGAKIAYGLITNCTSMAADGFHSLSDGASNLLGLMGVYISSKPIDEDHPYGHKKFETLFTLGIAAMLFFVAFNLLHQGFDRLFIHPRLPQVDQLSFVVMILTLVVNFLVMRYENRQGQILKSDILVADSLHTRTDIFVSFSVIAALIAVKTGLHHLDAAVTLMISGFIGFSAFAIVRKESGILVDGAAITDVKKIERVVLSVKDVKSCHKIRSRGRPDDIHLDLHVWLAPNLHLDKAHDISHQIQSTIKQEIPEVTDVVVHLEPDRRNKA
ncbi:MAG: cation diffusion facilitator family transporter [Candidatus Omnitrophota bacterium]